MTTKSKAWLSLAYHEAGHAVVARDLKIPLGEIVVYEDCSGGYTYCEAADRSHDDRAMLYVTGAVAGELHAHSGRGWRHFLQAGDAALLAEVTPPGNARAFKELAAFGACSTLVGMWRDVERTVNLLRRANGSLELSGGDIIPTRRLSQMPGTLAYESCQLESARSNI